MPIRPENVARYPKDWKLRSRFVRQYRAKNRCEWCGVKVGGDTQAGGHAHILLRSTLQECAGEFPWY